MTESTVTLRRASGDTTRDVERLLTENDLPTDDLSTDDVRLYVARADTCRVGVGGLEVHGSDALLRSVAVERDERGAGYGTAIVRALEAEASDADVDRLYLLTTTAGDFFDARGYAEIDRNDVPETIRTTAQFTDLCPSSATVMRKSL